MDNFFKNNGTKWDEEDLEYLKEWYFRIPVEEMCFALERGKASVIRKAQYLIETGKMNKLKRRNYRGSGE